ncbi:MAG: NAD(+) synthase [Polyangiaceae bacterium]|nr:NAD(+) synthase [Polyangiaceae bacterium]
MRLIRVAIASVNTTVGAVRSNVDKAIAVAQSASSDAATIVVFPEQLISGYAPEDLVQWAAFVEAQWKELERFAKATRDLPCAMALGLTVRRGAHVYNAAAIVHAGQILGIVPKEKLPTYNVFYESRVFARGLAGLLDEVHGISFGDLIFDFDFGSVALEVCEDLWSPGGPMRRRAYAGAELVVNLSASPFRLGVQETRREMIATRAGDNLVTVAYANLVGGNDGLVFDGGGFVAQNGRIVLEAPRFREGVSAVTVDLDRTTRLRTENTTWRADQEAFATTAPRITRVRSAHTTKRETLRYPVPTNRSFFLPDAGKPAILPHEAFCEDLLDALALGIGDYFEKTGVFKTIGVALSGGRDSLLCLYLARRWIRRRYGELGPAKEKEMAQAILRAFYMPSRYSSAETRHAAEQAARDLDAPLAIAPIDDAFERELGEIEKMLQPGEVLSKMARQNIQARVRAARMWTWANSAGGLFLQTSNMSEKAVGYTTIGGDMEGALSVIANVPKTVVNALLDYLQKTTKLEGIRLTLDKPASAELDDDQQDEKDLMPFAILDACFALYAGEKMSLGEVREVLFEMFPEYDRVLVENWASRFARLFTASIYKWVQTALCLHVGNLDLDRERALQLPVVQKSEWGVG